MGRRNLSLRRGPPGASRPRLEQMGSPSSSPALGAGSASGAMAAIDAVVVSYRSRETLRGCVEPLCRTAGVAVTVVDNDSPDDSAETIADLPLEVIHSPRNGGFAYGCNLGAAAGSAPYVLLLNPDARIDGHALAAMARVLDREPGVAAVGPRIVGDGGELHWSQRSFPRLRSTWSQALFLHRIAPLARWADELIRDPAAYARTGSPEWLSGACLLVRRSALAAVGGLDERFFLYCEDIDLCRRLREAGHELRFEPAATVRHRGGASAPLESTLPIYALSRVLYARKHYPRLAVPLEVAGVVLGEATHILTSIRRPSLARGHAAALRAALRNPAPAL
jgi:N-acetylglucosaminyl-diphospho-decaprenol L-rhamnosyltransferase